MNKFFASGYMVSDPKKIGESEKGPVVVIKLAVDSGKDKTSFPEIKAFGKIAETALTHYRKGAYLETISEFQSEQYEKDGETIYTSSFVLQEFPKVVVWPKDQSTDGSDNNQPD